MRRADRHVRGSTSLEVSLALLIALLAIWLSLLLLGRAVRHQRSERFIADLQAFSAAFQDYRQQRGAWPPSTTAQVTVPRGMDEILEAKNWSKGSPFGGNYGWVEPSPIRAESERSAREGTGAVVLTAFSPAFPLEVSRAELLEFDRRLDDGNLATGRFRTGFNGWPVFLIGEKR